jgi:hypothetical protein
VRRLVLFLVGHLIVYRLQGALEDCAVGRVSGPAQLRHDARARSSQGLKLRATGALSGSGTALLGPSVSRRLLPFEYFFHLLG